MKKVTFIAMLTPEDRYRHHHVRFKGEILSFVIQYETILERGMASCGKRYDTEHGFAHRDIIYREGNKLKTPMFTRDYNEALTFAEYDIKSNWRVYKKAFLGGKEYEHSTE